MGYLTKSVLLKSYSTLSNVFPTKDQGLTTAVSMIRYSLAFDMFFKSKGTDLDCNDIAMKNDFVNFVGKVVAIGDEYTTNFYDEIIAKPNYGTSSNFFSAAAMQKTKVDPSKTFDYPSKMPAVLRLQNYHVIQAPSLYPNLSSGYLKTQDIKTALLLWLCRNNDIDDTIGIYEGIVTIINSLFTPEMATELIISKADFDTIYATTYSDALSSTQEIVTKQDYLSSFSVTSVTGSTVSSSTTKHIDKWVQKILFGTPGAGKSHRVKDIIQQDIDNGYDVKAIRTVFHPDSDYSSFVGSYKPIMESKPFIDNTGTVTKTIVEKIAYRFVPQAFLQAYKLAWENPDSKIYLIIEEINRGNCAQIFGDTFQLLDRTDGFSEYPICASEEMKDYLSDISPAPGGLEKIKDIIGNLLDAGIHLDGIDKSANPKLLFSQFLCLPENFNILATMNTSDQSLFPMDSAFKRRWDMEYVEIMYDGSGMKSDKYTFEVNRVTYPWIDFLKIINEKIYDATKSEDKQMGNFFIKRLNTIEEDFKSKVMFYLWDEICKDLAGSKLSFFFITLNGKKEFFTYADLYKSETKFLDAGVKISGQRVLELFLKENHIPTMAEKIAASTGTAPSAPTPSVPTTPVSPASSSAAASNGTGPSTI